MIARGRDRLEDRRVGRDAVEVDRDGLGAERGRAADTDRDHRELVVLGIGIERGEPAEALIDDAPGQLAPVLAALERSGPISR